MIAGFPRRRAAKSREEHAKPDEDASNSPDGWLWYQCVEGTASVTRAGATAVPSVLAAVRLAAVFFYQLVELIQQLAECVPADDPLAVGLGNASLPHPEPAIADDHAWVRSPECLEPEQLVRLL